MANLELKLSNSLFMKKQLLSVVAVLGLSAASFAQIGPVSLGAEIVTPLGDFGDVSSLGYGASAGYEHPVGDKIGVTANIGYIMLSLDDEAKTFFKSYSMIPIQVGARYYLGEKSKGAYIHGQVGVHSLSVTTKAIDLGILGSIPETTSSDSYLSFGGGAGFMISDKLDINVRYSIITPDSEIEGATASTYAGVRIGYTLFGSN
jgi:hypothetical protein